MASQTAILSTVFAAFVFATGCKPVQTESKESASARGSSGQYLRCGTILPSVEKVAIKSLGTMVRYAKTGGSHAMALTVSKNTVNMLNNMMRHPTNPIHPVAFFAAVKDFESAANLSWATKGASGLKYFRTGNCTSGECFGLFQVDVKLESAWRGGAFCQSDGLNLWSTTAGGPDFCAAQFWWTVAEGGRKCAKLAGNTTNPCNSPSYTWTLSEVNKGRAAYVQAIQSGWDNSAWAEMYKNYERCYSDKKPLLQAIAEFKESVGLALPRVAVNGMQGDVVGFGEDYGTYDLPKPEETDGSWTPSRDSFGEVVPGTINWDWRTNLPFGDSGSQE
jgi:hypothetical protein